MALIGTISGSADSSGALTSNNAISGTLVISNGLVTPQIPTDAIMLVSPSAGSGLKSVFGGDIRVSGSAILDGDIAVNGGDLTSTASTFNLATNIATQLNVGGVTPTIELGSYGGSSTTRLAYGQTVSPAVKNIEIGTRGNSGSTTNITMGVNVAGVLGRITMNQDVALATGNLIGAPGSGANVMSLISSGNIILKLDTDNSAPGHRFEIQDYLGGTEFAVSETGDAEITGNLLITGSALNTRTTTTFNLLNTTLTGTLNVGSATTVINMGGIGTTTTLAGDIAVNGTTYIGNTVERLFNTSSGGGIMDFSLGPQSIFYVNNPTSDVTPNFINVPTNNLRVITPTVILSQSASPKNVPAVRIENVVQTINWAGGTSPTVTANRQEVFGFSLIRSGSAWKVLGQMTSYG